MKSNIKVIIFYVVLIGVFLAAIATVLSGFKTDDISYGEMEKFFLDGNVKRAVIDDDNVLTIETKDGKVFSHELRDIAIFVNDLSEEIKQQVKDGTIEEFNIQPVTRTPWWLSFLPYVIILVLFVVVWFYFMNQATGRGGKMSSFGKARVKLGGNEKDKVLFSDVAGADEEKEELEEVVAFLKDPAKFTKLGARIPHGVLLVGPPGTGKTLLAKAVAGEANVPFYSISGSDFVEMYVGVGASRVRDLFETAKKNPASIIFIDEIDAVGRHRGAGLGGGHDEREQTLNQLLVEMDGFGSNSGVIVMAATNRPDILDPALLRPGRFDRQITVNYPDIQGREDILKVHSRNKPFEKDVDLARIAHETVGFTGADLANLLNEAALLAARKGKSLIGMDDIEEASIKVMVGTQKKSMKIKDSEKLKTAYHEAGHAIIAHVLPSLDPVRRISIIPSGKALGYTLNPPVEDKYSVYKNGLKDQIAMLLGGRAAEKIIFNDISGGASNDIQRATSIARNMVTRLGMSDVLGPITYGGEHDDTEVFLGRDFNNTKNYSEQTAATIDEEIKKVISEQYDRAIALLNENIDKLHFVAKYLAAHEILDDKQFKKIMDDPFVTVEEIERMAAEAAAKSKAENEKRAKENEENARREKEERENGKHRMFEKDSDSSGLDAYAEYLRRENRNDSSDSDKKD